MTFSQARQAGFSETLNSNNATTVDLQMITNSIEIPIEVIENRSGNLLYSPEYYGFINFTQGAYTHMGVAYKDGYYYLSSGGSPNKPIGRFNEDLDFVDSYTFPLDSRGLVLNPGDGELYARSYAGGIYRVNTDNFNGSVEFVRTFSIQ